MDVHDRGGIGPQEESDQINPLLRASTENIAFPAALGEKLEAAGDALKQGQLSAMLAAMSSGAAPYSIIDDNRLAFAMNIGAALASVKT